MADVVIACEKSDFFSSTNKSLEVSFSFHLKRVSSVTISFLVEILYIHPIIKRKTFAHRKRGNSKRFWNTHPDLWIYIYTNFPLQLTKSFGSVCVNKSFHRITSFGMWMWMGIQYTIAIAITKAISIHLWRERAMFRTVATKKRRYTLDTQQDFSMR